MGRFRDTARKRTFTKSRESQGLTLVDTGHPGSAAAIIDAVHKLGREVSDLRQILVPHCHADHTGDLAVK